MAEYASHTTIVAQATPPGRGGVAVVRVSGALAPIIAKALLGKLPKVRVATYARFIDDDGETLDEGIALYFAAPNSYTGEDVLELQGHGGPVVVQALIERILACGAIMAGPGEFTYRAYMNNKLDLTQAEAVADLIDARSEQAARMALRSLQGAFSDRIESLQAQLTRLRVYIEAAIDFPEEDIDFLSDDSLRALMAEVRLASDSLIHCSEQGVLYHKGFKVVVAGRPNAGKSSLLNALSGEEAAIVTNIPGTTRDIVKTEITLDGIPLQILDTAGLRQSDDPIEQEGIRRAWEAISQADHVLYVIDGSENAALIPEDFQDFRTRLNNPKMPLTLLRNKADLLGLEPCTTQHQGLAIHHISAKTGDGIAALAKHLLQNLGATQTEEADFIARQRHVDALKSAHSCIDKAASALTFGAGEIAAEELRVAQQALSTITGEMSADDLLGEIFSTFCIGK